MKPLILVQRTTAAPQSPYLLDLSVKIVSAVGRVCTLAVALSRLVITIFGWISRYHGGRVYGIIVSIGAILSRAIMLP